MEILKPKTVDLGKFTSTYTEEGQGEKVIILFPGWPVGASAWRGVQSLLAAEGNRVIVANIPGFGGSEPLPRQYTYENLAEWAVRFSESLQVKDPIFGGISFGGCVALSVGVLGFGQSQIAVSPPISPKEYIAKDRLIAWRTIENIPGLAHVALKMLKAGNPLIVKIALGEELNFSDQQILAVFQESVVNLQLRPVKDTLNLMLRTNLTDTIKNIKTPFIIAVGSEEMDFIEQANLVTRNPRIIKGAGHKSVTTHPREIASLFRT